MPCNQCENGCDAFTILGRYCDPKEKNNDQNNCNNIRNANPATVPSTARNVTVVSGSIPLHEGRGT